MNVIIDQSYLDAIDAIIDDAARTGLIVIDCSFVDEDPTLVEASTARRAKGTQPPPAGDDYGDEHEAVTLNLRQFPF